MTLLTKSAAAELLGVSTRTLDRLRREGLLPHVQIKSCVRFHPADVHKLIAVLRGKSDPGFPPS